MADKVGYIYLATNETMPGLVKIGMTTGDVKERLKQLSAETGVPKPFKCPFSREVKNPSDVEKHLHELFGWCRVNDKREFFETDFRNVKNALLTMGMDNATTFPDIPKEESNISDEDVNSLALIEAVKTSDSLSEVERLLDAGADPNMVNANGETALTESIWQHYEPKNDKRNKRGILDYEDGWDGWKKSYDSVTKQLLWAGAKPNLKGKNGKTALFQAVIYGKSYLANLLLNAGANVNAQNSSGETPLFYIHWDYDGLHDGLKGQRKNVLEILLKAGADVNLAKKNGETPLHAFMNAFALSDYDIVLELLNAGAKVNAVGKDGNTPLHLAPKTKCSSIVGLLLKNGAEINSINHKGETPLYIAAYEGGGCDVVELLLAAGENPNLCDNKYRSPLDVAKFINHNKIADLLIEHGGMSGKDILIEEINNNDDFGSSHLLNAIKNGDVTHVKRLLDTGCVEIGCVEVGCDTLFIDREGNAPLHIAAKGGYAEIIRLLINTMEYSPSFVMESVNGRNVKRETPLHIAAYKDNLDVVKLLIDSGANPDYWEIKGETPLYVAAHEGNVNVVKLLLNSGANPNWIEQNDRTPLDAAQFLNHNEVARLLLEYGGKLGKNLPIEEVMKMNNIMLVEYVRRNDYNSNFLTAPIRNGDVGFVRRLLEAGVKVKDAELVDAASLYENMLRGGYTKHIHEAAHMGYVEITRLILEYSSEELDLEMEELIESRDADRDTPLFCAAMSDFDEKNHEDRMNSTETVELLIQYGADVNATKKESGDFYSPLDMAKSYGNAETVELLKKHGAKTGAELHSGAET